MSLNVSQFRALAKEITAATQADDCHVVPDEGNAINRLRDRVGIQVVWVIPSKGYSGAQDRLKKQDTTLVFVLIADVIDQLEEDLVKQYDATLEVAEKIVNYLANPLNSDYECILQNVEYNEIVMDPLYREFGNWNGYTFAFSI